MLDYIFNVLFPPKCIFCGEEINIGKELQVCEKCYSNLPFLTKRGFQTDHLFKADGFVDGVICLLEYDEMVKKCITNYKFHNRPAFYRTFSKMLSEKVKLVTKCIGFDIIISIPLHRQKERKRGYNQSFLISRHLGKDLGIPDGSKYICRTVNNCSQSHLGKQQRYMNVKGVFTVTRPQEFKGKRILVVDDIFTTGSTLNECARVLKTAGAISVTGAVIASGRKHWTVLNNNI